MSKDYDTILKNAEEASAAKLELFWHNAELASPSYPVYTDTVLAMVDGNGYVCDRGLLLELVDSRQIPVERDESGSLRWTATNCHHLLCQLEGRRRWKPFHPLHHHKFNAIELAQVKAESAGRSSCFDDVDAFDIEALLVFMAEADERPLREVLRVAILTKLKTQGAL
ncbi:MAG: hypothetical protein KDA52_12765 [Planctomycetaceae bacterium]|nr:hypothetical protein [Planctomycetaceae bacterium]